MTELNNKCQTCKENEANELHSCPYAEDVNNNSDTLCNCCDKCTHECCMDI